MTELGAEALAGLPPEQVPRNSALRGEGVIVGPKWPIALVSMVAALIAILDVSIVNVALPSIRASIGATLQETSWIATGYIVANVIIIPMTGFFQKRFGFRAYFSGSIALFTFASFLCSLSWNLPSLVLFRMLQGVGGGALIPTASAVMLDRFPRSERTMALAVFGVGAMMGPMLGPSLGGWLTDQFSWHMIFLINVPVGIIGLFLINAILREDRSEAKPVPVDGLGIFFLAGWLATMQYVLEEGNADGWFDSPLISVLTFLSVMFFVLFIHHELTTDHPVANLRLFRDPQYAGSTLIGMGLGMMLFGGVYLFSLYCGVILGYTASETGHLIFYAALLQGVMMPMIGRFGDRFDPRKLVALGTIAMATSLFLQTRFTGVEGTFDLLVPQYMRVFGMAFLFIPINAVAMAKIEAKDIGEATGLFSLTRELGGSIGTATFATILTSRSAFHHSRLGEAVNALSTAANERMALLTAAMGRLGDPGRAHDAALQALDGQMRRQSLILAFNDGFAVATCVAIALLLVIATLDRPENPGRPMAGGH